MNMIRSLSSKTTTTPDRLAAKRISEKVFSISTDIRSVAVYLHGKLATVSRPILSGASWWDSDKYEELIVNPTLLTLLRQRGDIDCGGIQYIIIRYGNFVQFVHPVIGGHISVGFEPNTDYGRFLPGIIKYLRKQKLINVKEDSHGSN